MPPENFWDAVGGSLEKATGDIVVAALVIVAVVYIIAKYYIPARERDREHRHELENKQLEIEARRQEDDVSIKRANVDQMAHQIEILSNQSELIKALTSQISNMEMQNEVIRAQILDSKSHSNELGSKVDEIQDEVHDISTKVGDIHIAVLKKEV